MEKASEIWKDISYNKYTSERYAISVEGSVMYKNTRHILVPQYVGGQYRVTLQVAGSRQRNFCIKDLVKAAFGTDTDFSEQENGHNQIDEDPITIEKNVDGKERHTNKAIVITINISC